MQSSSKSSSERVTRYWSVVEAHAKATLKQNESKIIQQSELLVSKVKAGGSLFIFGSGHSSIFAFELYHRAGGASFVVPMVADFLMPTTGPHVVRNLERQEGLVPAFLRRFDLSSKDVVWVLSQSGINAASVDCATFAKAQGAHVVAFTSLSHSQQVSSRHSSGKKLYECAHDTVDLGGVRGDAAITLSSGVSIGPLSSLLAMTLGHTIVGLACETLESEGHSCVYTSVNTPEGESKNRLIEKQAGQRDSLLR